MSVAVIKNKVLVNPDVIDELKRKDRCHHCDTNYEPIKFIARCNGCTLIFEHEDASRTLEFKQHCLGHAFKIMCSWCLNKHHTQQFLQLCERKLFDARKGVLHVSSVGYERQCYDGSCRLGPVGKCHDYYCNFANLCCHDDQMQLQRRITWDAIGVHDRSSCGIMSGGIVGILLKAAGVSPRTIYKYLYPNTGTIRDTTLPFSLQAIGNPASTWVIQDNASRNGSACWKLIIEYRDRAHFVRSVTQSITDFQTMRSRDLQLDHRRKTQENRLYIQVTYKHDVMRHIWTSIANFQARAKPAESTSYANFIDRISKSELEHELRVHFY